MKVKKFVNFAGINCSRLQVHEAVFSQISYFQLSVPRKLRIPWEMGISQATEAVTLPVQERLAKFGFKYEAGQPRFSSHMLQLLQQCEQEQQQGHEKFPESASLTPPDSTQSSPTTVQTPSSPLPFPCPTNNSTSAGKMSLVAKAPKLPTKRRRYNRHNTSVKRRKKGVVPAVVLPQIDCTVQVGSGTSLLQFV